MNPFSADRSLEKDALNPLVLTLSIFCAQNMSSAQRERIEGFFERDFRTSSRSSRLLWNLREVCRKNQQQKS
jgi:hypothetical protein